MLTTLEAQIEKGKEGTLGGYSSGKEATAV